MFKDIDNNKPKYIIFSTQTYKGLNKKILGNIQESYKKEKNNNKYEIYKYEG